MSWARLAAPMRARTIDAAGFISDVCARVDALDDTTVLTHSPADLLARIRKGWECHRLPDYPDAVIVRSPHGWAYQPTGDQHAAAWEQDTAAQRRRHLIDACTRQPVLLYPSLGDLSKALLEGDAPRLSSGVWSLLKPHLSAEEFEAAQFLHALGGVLSLPDRIFALGGLPTDPA